MLDEFTTREAAVLADVPIRVIDKAVEENVLTGIRSITYRGKRRRMLPLHAVPYAAIVKRLTLSLSLAEKRKLARELAGRPTAKMTSDPLEIAPAVSVDVARLIGADMAERASDYAASRDAIIEENPDVLGGTAVIKGTRLSVYALLGRIDGGDTIDAVIEDYPHLDREAIGTAVLYARSHPLVGRPGGKPWKTAA